MLRSFFFKNRLACDPRQWTTVFGAAARFVPRAIRKNAGGVINRTRSSDGVHSLLGQHACSGISKFPKKNRLMAADRRVMKVLLFRYGPADEACLLRRIIGSEDMIISWWHRIPRAPFYFGMA